MQLILDAIQSGASGDDIANLPVPESYRGVHVLKAEQEMWAGVASKDKDPRLSLHVGDVPTPELAPDEVYLQTALGWAAVHDPASRSLVIKNDCRRYFDFSESTFNHPRTFTLDDLPAVIGSDADFARKFDEARFPGVLDAVDAHLRQRAGEDAPSVTLDS